MVMEEQQMEQEVIILKAIQELINNMVNNEMLSLAGNDPDSNIKFQSITHQSFFNIILVDFLSCTDKNGPVKPKSYLAGLREISNNPQFNVDNSVALLQQSAEEFKGWLEQEVEVDVPLPFIEKETKLKIKRLDFLKITGNISKHNYLRSSGVAKDLKERLENSGIKVEANDELIALANFHERFHTEILNYHGSTIAEFLNNIRWGIYEYLRPEFHRSIVWDRDNPPFYKYKYPQKIKTKFAKTCYEELMNAVRVEPHMRKFEVTKWLKRRY